MRAMLEVLDPLGRQVLWRRTKTDVGQAATLQWIAHLSPKNQRSKRTEQRVTMATQEVPLYIMKVLPTVHSYQTRF